MKIRFLLPLLIAVFPLILSVRGESSPGDIAVVARSAVSSPVTLTDTGPTWTIDNGIVKTAVNKANGTLKFLVYKGINIPERQNFWEQNPGGKVTASVTINPNANGGERAEVSVKGVNGRMDIEVRYCIERGVSGIYTYAIYSHPASYPRAGLGESRFIMEMNPTFNWLSVDADRNMLMCDAGDLGKGVVIHAKEQRILSTGWYKNSVEHKYSYCAQMYKLPAYGWSSVKDHVGVWFINPSTEYIGGGATRLDLVCHMTAAILDYWTSGHYAGGAACDIPAGQSWNKVVGPIFVYFNSLANYERPSQRDLSAFAATAGNPFIPTAWRDNAFALWQDALGYGKMEKAKWPYDWVKGVDYPHKEQRGTVTGQFRLDDPQARTTSLPHLTVGLAHPDFTGPGSAFALRAGNGNLVTWEHDANYYQFWADGTDDGKFTIPNIRPGTYTLHAFADGVLGEYTATNITVTAGKAIDLGTLDWKPVRYGKQIWEIGYPDRTADKFFKGDGANYWLWGWPERYALLFPHDIVYTIGKSDYHKDWFFEEVPHAENLSFVNPAAKDPANQRFGWVKTGTPGQDMWRTIGHGRATTWTIKFNLNDNARGVATLRVALAGSDGGGGLGVRVNGSSVGTISYISTNALRYNTDKGIWRQYLLKFDARVMKPGENEMQLTVPAGELTSGVVWDYLRLEMDENARIP